MVKRWGPGKRAPKPNLVPGMKWMPGVYSQGWNRRRHRQGNFRKLLLGMPLEELVVGQPVRNFLATIVLLVALAFGVFDKL